MSIRIGLAGYGQGGRYFHAPFIQAAVGCDLVGVVTRSPTRVRQVEAELPGTPVHRTLGDLIDAGVDAVVLSTPPVTRRGLVLDVKDHAKSPGVITVFPHL